MAYFVKLYDKDFNVIGSDNWVKTQYAVQTYTLKRKANEFDEFTVTCEAIYNSDKAVYVGLHDENGYMLYISFCGTPITKDGYTEIEAIDIRKLLKQYTLYDQTLNSSGTISARYNTLISKALDISEVSDKIQVDVDELSTSSITFNKNVLTGEYKETNIWETLQYWNSFFHVLILVEVDYGSSQPIIIRVRPMDQTITLNLNDYDIYQSEDLFEYNCCYGAFYHEAIYKEVQSGDTTTKVEKYPAGVDDKKAVRYYRLSNNDIVAEDDLDETYQATDTGFGYINGTNIFAGNKKSAYKIYPVVRKYFTEDISNYYDESTGEIDTSTTTTENLANKLTDLKSKATEELENTRYKQSVEITLESKATMTDIYPIFLDSDGNEDTLKPLRYFGLLYNYNSAELKTQFSNASDDLTKQQTFKLIPLSEISIRYTSSGRRTLSVKFGYLSEYWFLNRD